MRLNITENPNVAVIRKFRSLLHILVYSLWTARIASALKGFENHELGVSLFPLRKLNEYIRPDFKIKSF